MKSNNKKALSSLSTPSAADYASVLQVNNNKQLAPSGISLKVFEPPMIKLDMLSKENIEPV